MAALAKRSWRARSAPRGGPSQTRSIKRSTCSLLATVPCAATLRRSARLAPNSASRLWGPHTSVTPSRPARGATTPPISSSVREPRALRRPPPPQRLARPPRRRPPVRLQRGRWRAGVLSWVWMTGIVRPAVQTAASTSAPGQPARAPRHRTGDWVVERRLVASPRESRKPRCSAAVGAWAAWVQRARRPRRSQLETRRNRPRCDRTLRQREGGPAPVRLSTCTAVREADPPPRWRRSVGASRWVCPRSGRVRRSSGGRWRPSGLGRACDTSRRWRGGWGG
mmetsp:Transcript_11484/g.37934  ORF Transcript_11484/g.37934 Transcript_11484/m.37934 type:complete len:281 (+) Transcript_11484:327-1169(+)